jgi:hypothetical protein
MLTVPNFVQKGIFERIVRSRTGTLMRVHFEVYEVNGELKGKVLRVEPILSINGSVEGAKCLTGASAANSAFLEYISPLKSVLSPYIELYFFNSQPTRAPSK